MTIAAGGTPIARGPGGAGIEPFYFGDRDRSLFGCHQAPLTRMTRTCGILLCYPIGPEYIRSHRAFRQLAARLSKAGFHVLRFDYSGCGDSAGDFETGRLDDWQRSISLAVDELKRRAGLSCVCVIGLRLGATMALLVGARRGCFDAMVLWNSVCDGAAYVRELQLWHESAGGGADPNRDDGFAEIVGYAFNRSLLDDIAHVDPLALLRQPAKRILFVHTGDTDENDRLPACVQQLGAVVDRLRIPGPQLWLQEPYQAVIPHQALQSIVSWVTTVYA